MLAYVGEGLAYIEEGVNVGGGAKHILGEGLAYIKWPMVRGWSSTFYYPISKLFHVVVVLGLDLDNLGLMSR